MLIGLKIGGSSDYDMCESENKVITILGNYFLIWKLPKDPRLFSIIGH